MHSPSDRDPSVLLAGARGGDAAAVGMLLELHRNYLSLLLRVQVGVRLRAKVDVEDLVQEVLLEAHRGFARFAGESHGELLAWLRTIVAGVLSNQVRRYFGTQRRNVRLERSLADDLDRSSHTFDRAFVAPESSPSHQAARREQVVLLADALAALPVNYREVIILRQLEGLPFPEVACRMGRSLDSVKNLWVRARARLRRELDTEP